MIDIMDCYRIFNRYFRSRRMRQFAQLFCVREETRIIDLGGSPYNWSFLQSRPDVTIVNIRGAYGVGPTNDPKLHVVFYDGRTVPFADNSFAICYSNSVIEHVGDRGTVRHFAAEIRRLAPRYYVQTPNPAFFIEPHFLCAFVHWLPYRIKRRLLRYMSVWGLIVKPSQDTIDQALHEVNLLTYRQMVRLFPEATIVKERVFGLTKSFIAVKA